MLDTETNNAKPLGWFTAAVCLLGCVYYFVFFYNRAHVELEIDVEHKSSFKLYWTAGEKPFSEKKRAVVTVRPGQRSYSFYLTNLDNVEKVRVDPFQYPGTGTLKKLRLTQSGYQPFEVNLDSLEPLHHITESKIGPDGITIQSSGSDPYFLLEPSFDKARVDWPMEAARYLLICVLVVIILTGCGSLAHDFAFVPLLLAVVLGLIVVMATVSNTEVTT